MTRIHFFFLLFWIVQLALMAQSPPLPKELFDKKACGCEYDKTRFNDATYARQIRTLFSSAGIYGSFKIDNQENKAIVQIIQELSANFTNLKKSQWLQKLDAQKPKIQAIFTQGDYAQQWETIESEVRRALPKAKNYEPWAIYTVCNFAELAHLYYRDFPSEAPNNHTNTYQTIQNNTNPKPTGMPPFEELKWILIIAGGFAFVAFLLAVLVARSMRPSFNQEAAIEAVLASPKIQKMIELIAQTDSRWKQNLLEVQTQMNALAEASSKVNTGIPADLEQKLAAMQEQIRKVPIVDVGLVEKLLNEFNKRIIVLEQLPRTANGEVMISPEDLAKFIQSNERVRAAMQESLNVNLLQDTIMRLFPKQLEIKDLDSLEKETLRRFWKLYSLGNEYLPQFKEQVKQEIKNELLKK